MDEPKTPTSVWLVWTGEYEGRCIIAAFSDKRIADAYVAHQVASPGVSTADDYEVEELALDGEDFPRGAWCYEIQEAPNIGGWSRSCYWHSGVNVGEPSTSRGPILVPRTGAIVGGASWKGYGASPLDAQAAAESYRQLVPLGIPDA